MGIKYLNAVWERAPYEGRKLLVLLAIADYCSDEGYCYPSVRTLAKKARCTRKTVQDALGLFGRDGVLRVIMNGGPMACNAYQMDLRALSKVGQEKDAEPEEPDDGQMELGDGGVEITQGHNGLQDGGVMASQGGVVVTPKPSVEPSDKPSFNFLTGVEIESRTERQTVLECADIWKSSFGILNIGLAFKVLRPVIAELGHEKTIEALKKYCAETKREHQPTLFKFSNVAVAYAKEPGQSNSERKIMTIQEMVPE